MEELYKIKPLQWEHSPIGGRDRWTAGKFEVCFIRQNLWRAIHGYRQIEDFSSVVDAKKACEVKHVTKVLPYLEKVEARPTPSMKDCPCMECNTELIGFRMFLCRKCGNKRCPKADSHRFKCTNSNSLNQQIELEPAAD